MPSVHHVEFISINKTICEIGHVFRLPDMDDIRVPKSEWAFEKVVGQNRHLELIEDQKMLVVELLDDWSYFPAVNIRQQSATLLCCLNLKITVCNSL